MKFIKIKFVLSCTPALLALNLSFAFAGEDFRLARPYDASVTEAVPVGLEQPSIGVNPCPGGEIDKRSIADGGGSFIFAVEFGKNGVPDLKELQSMSQDELNRWYFDRLMQQFAQRKSWSISGYDLCRPDGIAVGFDTPIRGSLRETATLVKLESGSYAVKTSYNGTIIVHCCMPKK